MIAFTLLHFLPYCKRERRTEQCDPTKPDQTNPLTVNKEPDPTESPHETGNNNYQAGGEPLLNRTEPPNMIHDDNCLEQETFISTENVLANNSGLRQSIGGQSNVNDTATVNDGETEDKTVNAKLLRGDLEILEQDTLMQQAGSVVIIDKNELEQSKATHFMYSCHFFYLIFLIVWVNATMYGILPPIQSYACLPYGTRAYNLALRLGLSCNPIFSIVALLRPMSSLVGLGVLVGFGTVGVVYQVFLAVLSPEPPLTELAVGEVLAVSGRLLCIYTVLKNPI